MTDSTSSTGTQIIRENSPCPRELFSNWLRQEREIRGVSIESIAQATKISKAFISGLESGEFEGLPGRVFGRGFVKNITRLLNCDGAEGLKLYDACWDALPPSGREFKPLESAAPFKNNNLSFFKSKSSKPENITFPLSPKDFVENYLPSRRKRRTATRTATSNILSGIQLPTWLARGFVNPQVKLWALGILAFAFVSLVFGRWAASHIHQTLMTTPAHSVAPASALPQVNKTAAATNEVDEFSTPDLSDSVPAAAVSNTAVSNTAVSNTAVSNTAVSNTAVSSASANNSTKTMISQEDNPLYLASGSAAAFEQVIALTVLTPVEIRVTLDGKKQERTSYTPDAYRFTFNERAEVYIGDASQVTLAFNGKSLGVLGNKGRKRRVMFQGKASDTDFPK